MISNHYAFTCIIVLFLISVFCGSQSWAANDRFVALMPVANELQDRYLEHKSEIKEEYELRTGVVSLAVDNFLPPAPDTDKRRVPAASLQGRNMLISFFPDQAFDIEINTESRPEPDILSINGRLSGRDLDTFSMTITSESYLITFQDIEAALIYRVVGETASGMGYVTEIDPSKMPPREYLPPVIPGE